MLGKILAKKEMGTTQFLVPATFCTNKVHSLGVINQENLHVQGSGHKEVQK